ncbi:response regulator transcription factor [Marinisporobacter balticus]|uniref:Stage 0 sporulation protein A homolog n=1 Tax=Marinisporobacter balticus TaxID=2018667 RepID=A0A4R2L266_9FIRM|nr:response regulator [Marinisporobacter balticus]TCO77969.1 AraC family two component transcriptional regulator [Marinisporobacter balticus]
MYKVLIVEDEVLERKALKMIIEREFKDTIKIVGETGSGLEAVALDKQLKPNLILMDISIYELNGIEASLRIRKRDRNTIIIILTAHDEFDFAHKAILANINDYILKPARPKRIIEAIDKQISREIANPIDMECMMNALKMNIKKSDYKNSKYMLKEIINQIFNLGSDDVQSIATNLKEMVDSLMNIVLDLEIQNLHEIEKYFQKFKNDFDIFLNQYAVQKSLIEILNLIFENITNDNHETYSYDMNRILDYIEKKCKKNITLEEVAEFGSMSSYYLSRIFKKKVGINFSTYLISKKIEIAKELLEHTNMPIINIALELSYNEPNYFSKVFKKIVGFTPTDYRNSKKDKTKENIFKKNTFVSNGKWDI